MDTARIGAISHFAGLEESELLAIADAAYEIEVAQGETIAAEGDFGHALYAIEAGTVEVQADGRTIRTLGPGDVFGEIALIASGRRTANVVAVSPVRLVALFKRDVWKLEQKAPRASARLRELVAERRDEAPG